MSLMQIAFKLLGLRARAFEKATRVPEKAQEKILFEYLKRNESTEYGIKYGFGEIKSVEEYQQKVPIVKYSDIRPLVCRVMNGESGVLTSDKTIFFALTSGSTGQHKFIPVTPFSIKKKSQATSLWAYYIHRDYPDVFDGKTLVVVSPEVEGYTKAGIPFGAESGHGYKRMPAMVKSKYVLPEEVISISDYNSKYYAVLRLAIEEDISTIGALNPSTIVLLAHKIEEMGEDIISDIENGTLKKDLLISNDIRRVIEQSLNPNPKRAEELKRILNEKKGLIPADIWPNIKLIECWKGGTVGVYLAELKKYYGNVPVRDWGYIASEVRGSISIQDEDAGGVLTVDLNFYEFIPREDICKKGVKPLLSHELVEGGEYYIIMTTPGGLYRYDIDDIVRVMRFHNSTPVIEFVQKGKNVCSVTGEKLYEEQVVKAVDNAVKKQNLPVRDFTAYLQPGHTYCYSFLVEFGEYVRPEKKKEFLRDIDMELCDINCEYESKRKSQRLCHPELKVVKKGEFDKLRNEKVMNGTPDGQFKIPKLNNKLGHFENVVIEEQIRLD